MKGKSNQRNNMRGKQGRKDNRSKRVNFDNERESKFEKEIKDISKTSKSNDVSWYAHNAELLRSAASLPFSQTTGTPIGWIGSNTAGRDNVPGVMALHFNPFFGDTDAVNSSKESVYSYVVHANSRNTSYTASDLMLVILSGMQVFCAIGSAIRAYGTMKFFDQRNKYAPKAMISAMGFNYQNLQQNMSNMWFDINELIARATQIWIPNTFPVMDRWFWMNSNIYQDSSSVKGQYYMFVQDAFLGLNEKYSDAGGAMCWMTNIGTASKPPYQTGIKKYVNTEQHTWAEFMVMINGMIDNLLDSEDRGIIMGDILKAYGQDRLYAITPITAEYTVVPVYDTEVLSQIENATICNLEYDALFDDAGLNALLYQNTTQTAGPTVMQMLPDQAILNFHQEGVPTPEQIMVATRLTALGTFSAQTGSAQNVTAWRVQYAGTEYVKRCRVWHFETDGTLNFSDLQVRQTGMQMSLGTIYNWAAFDWAPWLYVVTAPTWKVGDSVALGYQFSNHVDFAIGDYDNYTVIQLRDLAQMHTTAVYSEFGVPTL